MPARRVYLDHNATTPMRPEAEEAMVRALRMGLGNPSSIHESGRKARAMVDEARDKIAAALEVDPDEVILTSGGTESNNLALLGSLAATPDKTGLITSPVEHAAVRGVGLELEAQGVQVQWLAVSPTGAVEVGGLGSILQHVDGPQVVSVMGANNELGTITDLEGVRAAIEGSGAVATLHCDAVQCLGKTQLRPIIEHVDLASFSSHKVGGPVGVGLLFKRTGVKLAPRTFGGSQEALLRPGTENVAAIAAAAVAVELAVQETEALSKRLTQLTCDFWHQLRARVPNVLLNGPAIDRADRLPNTLNVSFPSSGDARMLVTRFDLAGLEVSAGSACASGSLEPSHVLSTVTDDEHRALSAIRFSLGWNTSDDDVRLAVDILGTTLGEST